MKQEDLQAFVRTHSAELEELLSNWLQANHSMLSSTVFSEVKSALRTGTVPPLVSSIFVAIYQLCEDGMSFSDAFHKAFDSLNQEWLRKMAKYA